MFGERNIPSRGDTKDTRLTSYSLHTMNRDDEEPFPRRTYEVEVFRDVSPKELINLYNFLKLLL
jgi:hypothetical protein